MNMRLLLINMLAFGVVGAILPNYGMGCTTGGFWAVIICMMVVQVNSSFSEN